MIEKYTTIDANNHLRNAVFVLFHIFRKNFNGNNTVGPLNYKLFYSRQNTVTFYCLLDVITLNKVGMEYFPNMNAHLFLTQDSFTYKTIIALLCTIVYLTLCAHKYNHEKVVIKNSQKRKGQSRLYMYGKKFCKI